MTMSRIRLEKWRIEQNRMRYCGINKPFSFGFRSKDEG